MDFKQFLDENPEIKAKYERFTDEEKEKLSEAVKYVESIAANVVSVLQRFAIQVSKIAKKVVETYPNRRVFYLAMYSKKKRTRKKNMRRILKDIQKES